MRHFVIAAAGAFAALPVFAADHTVTAHTGPFRFDPPALTIDAGDTVTFVNGGGFHNVASDSGAVTAFRCANGCDGSGGNGNASSSAWTATVVFPTAGSAPFHCEIHGADGGGGMAGTITVRPAGGAPSIEVAPTTVEASADSGAAAPAAFTVGNTGTAALTWNADTAPADCAAPAAVPWLALAPAGGSVAAGAPAANVDVTLDAAALAPGLYHANICVHSNDAAHDPLTLPVVFTVNTPDLIFLDGFDG